MAIGIEEVTPTTLPESLPDELTAGDVESLMHRIPLGVRGYATLQKAGKHYLHHQRLVQVHRQKMVDTLSFIKGIRSPRKGTKDTTATVANRFFSGLSNAQLRSQCDVLGVEYTAYETVEDIVEACVNAFMTKIQS